MEENKERNSVLSETLNNTDEAELEEELAELMKENEFSPTSDDYLQFPTVSESNSELEQLEQRLNDLGIKSKYYKMNYIRNYISYKKKFNMEYMCVCITQVRYHLIKI